MMLFRSEHISKLSKPLTTAVVVLILATQVLGCVPAPTPTSITPEQTPEPPSPSATPSPAPTITPTLALIDGGLFYLAMGINPYQTLPIYQEPTPG